MKQGTKKLISLMLAVILALSLGSVSMAAEETGQKMEMMETVNGDVPVTRLAPGVTDDSLAYGRVTLQKSGSYYLYKKEVDVPKGVIYISVRGNSGMKQIAAGLFSDAALTRQVDGTSGTGTAMSRNIVVANAGTYYIGIRSESPLTLECAANIIRGEDREVSNHDSVNVGQVNEQTNYFKFKAEKTGYLEISGSEAYNKVTLCDKNKKALSGETEMRYNPTYGVTKGTVYYIKIQAVWSPVGGYAFQVNSQKIADKSGKTKSKAASLKKKDTKKGVILAGSSQADWYKFKLKKKKKVSILFDKMRTNGKFKVTVYRGSKKVASGNVTKKAQGARVDSKGKWQKGTYYIKIERANKKSSGYYTVSWQ